MSRKQTASALGVLAISLTLAGGVAWAGAHGGASFVGRPVMFWCAAIAFATQWVAFVPAYLQQTERFYDLTGSLTYAGVTSFALIVAPEQDARSWVLTGLVLVWAGRLGSFLYSRIRAEGADARFDQIKPNPWRFLVAWTLQGLWVFLTLCAALAAITTESPGPWGVWDWVGLTVWVAGFGIEVAADRQKSRFREERPGHFIDSGLWAWSRHPNYFGEIVLWIGIAIMAASTLRGWQWVTLVSPVFVAFLLTRVSGIPILEQRSDQRWGDDPAYRRYKSRTPALVPRPPRSD